MIMIYAVAAPFWILACLVGVALLVSARTRTRTRTRTRELAVYAILITTFGYWLPLLAAGTVLFFYQPAVASNAEPSRWMFAAIFAGSQALAGLIGMTLGCLLAFLFTRTRRVSLPPVAACHKLSR